MKKNLNVRDLMIMVISASVATSLVLAVFFYVTEMKSRETESLSNYRTSPNSNADDFFWAKQIQEDKRRYILWFRHAEREKWTGTVTVFDYFDVNKDKKELPLNWRPAVCLNSKGIAEAQIVGETFRKLDIKVSKIITSPSCRAKQTALNAFGRFDQEWLEILHPTAIPFHQQELFSERLKQKINLLISTDSTSDGVIVVTGHGNTLPFYSDNLFIDSHVKNWNINELGFILIEVTPKGLIAQHSFIDFYQFANMLLEYTN